MAQLASLIWVLVALPIIGLVMIARLIYTLAMLGANAVDRKIDNLLDRCL